MSNDRLKFRAWDGKSVRYDVTGFEHGHKNEMAGVFLDGDYFAIVDDLSECDEHNKGAVVMQWTGLSDGNGDEVYEGDIIQHPDGERAVIEYDAQYCGFRAMYGSYDSGMISLQIGERGLALVVGDRYENPELLDA